MLVILILILILAVFHVTMIDYFVYNPDFYQLDAYTWESDDFRSMQFGEYLMGQKEISYQDLTAFMIQNNYDLTSIKKEELHITPERILSRKPVEFKKLSNAYRILFEDLTLFPIPLSTNKETPDVTYEDGWMDKRTYGGERGHEGADLMGNKKERGFYPVTSMSDGVIEKVGWLEKGGWRIGIRTPQGVYLYYAHLYNYSKQWKEGDTVKAGELLGFMGDSGYSNIEGTVGNFDVHLHLGIYLKTDHYEELSVNPYWILRYLEKKRLKYQY